MFHVDQEDSVGYLGKLHFPTYLVKVSSSNFQDTYDARTTKIDLDAERSDFTVTRAWLTLSQAWRCKDYPTNTFQLGSAPIFTRSSDEEY
jgi:hypothetical protein